MDYHSQLYIIIGSSAIVLVITFTIIFFFFNSDALLIVIVSFIYMFAGAGILILHNRTFRQKEALQEAKENADRSKQRGSREWMMAYIKENSESLKDRVQSVRQQGEEILKAYQSGEKERVSLLISERIQFLRDEMKKIDEELELIEIRMTKCPGPETRIHYQETKGTLIQLRESLVDSTDKWERRNQHLEEIIDTEMEEIETMLKKDVSRIGEGFSNFFMAYLKEIQSE